jgi:hypothetical protein
MLSRATADYQNFAKLRRVSNTISVSPGRYADIAILGAGPRQHNVVSWPLTPGNLAPTPDHRRRSLFESSGMLPLDASDHMYMH